MGQVVRKYHLRTPLRDCDVKKLAVGDVVYVSGTIYTLRDRGARRLVEAANRGEAPPVDLKGSLVYHAGPLVQRSGGWWEVVSAGPTTSTRMEAHDPKLIAMGVKAIVGKGRLLEGTRRACREFGAVYMLYPGGCGALAAKSVKKVLAVYWLDLGMPEALWVLEVKDFGPLYVVMDGEGRDLLMDHYLRVRERYNKLVGILRKGVTELLK